MPGAVQHIGQSGIPNEFKFIRAKYYFAGGAGAEGVRSVLCMTSINHEPSVCLAITKSSSPLR